MMASEEVTVGCLECVMGQASKEELLKNARAVPGAWQEIRDALQ